jgi:hypothetical protein
MYVESEMSRAAVTIPARAPRARRARRTPRRVDGPGPLIASLNSQRCMFFLGPTFIRERRRIVYLFSLLNACNLKHLGTHYLTSAHTFP